MAGGLFTPETRKEIPPRGPGKLTKTVKETVLNIFNDIQSDPHVNLLAFAKKYPRDFYAIAARLIPTEITGNLRKVISVSVTNGNQQAQIENAKVIPIHGEVVQEDILNDDDDFFNL